jgi:hypothetical protein
MNPRNLCAVVAAFAPTTSAAIAMADVPACPAWAGGYVATVDGGSVTICATSTPPPGVDHTTCPYETGMVRVDVSTGEFKNLLGPCVADPASVDAADAGTPCFLDPCVPPGTYEYGYGIPPFVFCNESCAGPTSGEWATVVTVSSTACAAEAGPQQPIGLSPAIWRDVDAAVVDGAVVWSGNCTGPLPGPDGGLCAWEWLDGSAQWAPCPPDGGTLCPWEAADGATIPLPCPTSGTNGFGGAGNSNGPSIDAGASAPSQTGPTATAPASASSPPAASPSAAAGGNGGSTGCSMSPVETGAPLAALAALSLAVGCGVERRRRRLRASGGSESRRSR